MNTWFQSSCTTNEPWSFIINWRTKNKIWSCNNSVLPNQEATKMSEIIPMSASLIQTKLDMIRPIWTCPGKEYSSRHINMRWSRPGESFSIEPADRKQLQPPWGPIPDPTSGPRSKAKSQIRGQVPHLRSSPTSKVKSKIKSQIWGQASWGSPRSQGKIIFLEVEFLDTEFLGKWVSWNEIIWYPVSWRLVSWSLVS